MRDNEKTRFFMFSKLIELARRPKRPITKRQVMNLLLIQAAMLIFVLIVVTAFPERVMATGVFLFACLGIAIALWLDIRESGIVED